LSRVNWEDIWNRNAMSAQEMIPVELRTVRWVRGCPVSMTSWLYTSSRPEVVSSILYFSDKAPEGIAKALKATFPYSHEAGTS
jgi:hypothetical protein